MATVSTLALGSNYKVIIFILIIQNSSWGTRCEVASATGPVPGEINIGLGNGLMQSGNKPLT